MMRNRRVVIITLMIVVAVSFYIMRTDYKYKDEIGAYDIYTLAMLEKNIGMFIVKLEEENRDEVSIKEYRGRIGLLMDYTRRSPKLGFMNDSIYEIASSEIEEINQKDILWMKEVQQEIRRITLYLHDISYKNDNLGVKTYNYFNNDKNVNDLKEILNSNR